MCQAYISILWFLCVLLNELISVMEFLITQISLFVFVFTATSTTLLNPVYGGGCDFPAIFNFGASNSDTGGYAAAFEGPKPPHGDTYFHRPAGRYSDGRIIIDFIGNVVLFLVGMFYLP